MSQVAELMGDEGLLEAIEEETAELDQFLAAEASLPALVDQPSTPSADSEEEGWLDDPVSLKWEKIRSTFLNAKQPGEVYIAAKSMPLQQWLDWACKMAPKQPDQAQLKITAIRVELPPRDDAPAEAITVEVAEQ